MNLLPRSVIVLGLLAFFLIGLEQALFGPAFSALERRFELPGGAVGSIVTAHFLGVTLGTLSSGLLVARLGVRGMGVLSSLLCVLGLGLLSSAGLWGLALCGALLSGAGFGGISGGFNTVFSGLGRRGAPLLNILNAVWGLGSLSAPLLAVGVLGQGLGVYFGGAALLFALLSVGMLRLRTQAASSTPEQDLKAAPASRRLLVPFMLMLFLYSGLEVAASSWMVSHLTGSVGESRAKLFNSLFWVMLTVGRFVTAGLSLRFSPPQIVLGAGGLALLCAALTGVPVVAPYAYAALGLACAPVFPTGLAWFSSALPTLRGWVPGIIASASFGAAMVPAGVSAAVGAFGVSSVPVALGAVAAALFALVLVNARVQR